MKILIVSLFLPRQKASHAGSRYVFEVLRNLSRRHDIYLATRFEEEEMPYLDALKPYCTGIYPYTYKTVAKRGLWDVVRLVLNYIGFSRYADRLISKGNFDIVHVQWVEAALMIKKGRAPMVLDAHDVITKPAERLFRQSGGFLHVAIYVRYLLVRRLERAIARRFDVIFARSNFDKEYLLKMDQGLNVRTVPHPAGLDITEKIFEKRKDTILFLASYKYRKVNVDAALYFYKDVFPLIRSVIPEAKFIIAGYGPPEELTSIQERDSHVVVTGFVEDIDRCYKETVVFVAPILTGGGIIVKILDAMAAGIPVVTTSYGNEGIGAVAGRDLIVADDSENFAKAVVRLLNDPEFAQAIARNGREFVLKNYSLDSVMEKMEAAYQHVLKRPGS